MDRFDPSPRQSFHRMWEALPCHFQEVNFDLHGPGWTLAVVEDLGVLFCAFPGVFSTSRANFDSCSVLPFEMLVPPDTVPVTSRPYRANPIVAMIRRSKPSRASI